MSSILITSPYLAYISWRWQALKSLPEERPTFVNVCWLHASPFQNLLTAFFFIIFIFIRYLYHQVYYFITTIFQMNPPSLFQDRRILLLPLKVSDRSSERLNYPRKVIMKSAKSRAGTEILQKLVQFINRVLDVIPFLCCHLLKPPRKYLINTGRLSQEG